VKKGDAVSIYMPMVAELPIAMLACARIGAVHSVVFAGFSAESLAQRIDDCRCNVLLTCNGTARVHHLLAHLLRRDERAAAKAYVARFSANGALDRRKLRRITCSRAHIQPLLSA
jgi:acyl-coenzyme A synthetase/AMP-(fatty) acid ligase